MSGKYVKVKDSPDAPPVTKSGKSVSEKKRRPNASPLFAVGKQLFQLRKENPISLRPHNLPVSAYSFGSPISSQHILASRHHSNRE